MSNETKRITLIFSITDYFSYLGFNKMDLTERIIHLVFYVTNIAKLRVDMTPSIVTQRLDDVKTYFLQNSVNRKGIDNKETDYEKVRSIMENNPDIFVILENEDRRDRVRQDQAYSLSSSTCHKLGEELRAISEYIASIPVYEEEIRKRDDEITRLQHLISGWESRHLKRLICCDAFLFIVLLVFGLLSLFWTNENWNFIGRWLSTLFSDNNPLRNNLLSTLLVYLVTSPFLIRRISHNLRQLNTLKHRIET